MFKIEFFDKKRNKVFCFLKKFIQMISDISEVERISYRADINGLRAIAVLAVLFYHADFKLFKGGWLGVDIFFVISGYLISNIIISELNDGKFTFKKFYSRRAKRILPALFSMLFLTIPLAYFLLTPKAMGEYIDSLFASVFFYSNYHFMNLDFYVAEPTKVMPLLHTWSLAIEEQYYIFFPIFAYLIFKYFKKYFMFFVSLVFLSSLYLNSINQSTDKFYKLEFRLWELLAGVLVMLIGSKIRLKYLEKIGIPLMILPIFFFGDNWANNIEPKLLAVTGVSFIILSNKKNSLFSRIMNLKLISLIGMSSYSIYLLHQPIFAFYRILNTNKDLKILKSSSFKNNSSINILDFPYNSLLNDKSKILTLMLVLLTFIVGYISYRFIEIPFLKKLNIKYLMVLFFPIVAFTMLDPTPASAKNIINESYTTETTFSEYNCWNKINLSSENFEEFEDCNINNNSINNLIILGDSSSAAISKAIKQNNLFQNYNIIFASIDYTSFFSEFKSQDNCNNCLLTKIKDTNSTIIVSVELHRYIETEGIYYSEIFSNKNQKVFEENLLYLSNISNNVYLFLPFPTVPLTNLSPETILNLDNPEEINEIFIPYQLWIQNTSKTRNLLKNLKENSNIKIIQIEEVFCNVENQKCLFYKNPDLYYLDHVHLSKPGGYLVGKKVESIINNN